MTTILSFIGFLVVVALAALWVKRYRPAWWLRFTSLWKDNLK